MAILLTNQISVLFLVPLVCPCSVHSVPDKKRNRTYRQNVDHGFGAVLFSTGGKAANGRIIGSVLWVKLMTSLPP